MLRRLGWVASTVVVLVAVAYAAWMGSNIGDSPQELCQGAIPFFEGGEILEAEYAVRGLQAACTVRAFETDDTFTATTPPTGDYALSAVVITVGGFEVSRRLLQVRRQRSSRPS